MFLYLRINTCRHFTYVCKLRLRRKLGSRPGLLFFCVVAHWLCVYDTLLVGDKTDCEVNTPEERMCLYPPNGRWYRGKILQQQKGLLIYSVENCANKWAPSITQSQKLHYYWKLMRNLTLWKPQHQTNVTTLQLFVMWWWLSSIYWFVCYLTLHSQQLAFFRNSISQVGL